ncbi:MAG TPA: enoyl-CoA hydratase/isomerase family protein [candidate division Zixibacteria bacterium]|nr:enoyl-CoA hydratase/isomerase family protein [candidate division Zixibacteria bacterium]
MAIETIKEPRKSATGPSDYFEPKTGAEYGFKEILYEKKDMIATITINRPHSYNAYNTPCLKELATAFTDATWDDAVGVIIFTGAGDKAFCTGGDVKEYAEIYTQKPRDYFKYMGLFAAYIEAILKCGKPVICRLNGMAVGGGNESHMACDLSIMADDTYIGQIGTNVGSVACGGATQWLPIFVGDRRAREILYLNEKIKAEKAVAWGLVNQAVPRDQLDDACAKMAEKLLNKFPECMRYTKTQVNALKEQVWYQTIGHAREWLTLHFTDWEPNEGMQAFVEKRKADYLGLRRVAAEGGSSESKYGTYKHTCPSCGVTQLPSLHKFCGMCGAELKV